MDDGLHHRPAGGRHLPICGALADAGTDRIAHLVARPESGLPFPVSLAGWHVRLDGPGYLCLVWPNFAGTDRVLVPDADSDGVWILHRLPNELVAGEGRDQNGNVSQRRRVLLVLHHQVAQLTVPFNL